MARSRDDAEADDLIQRAEREMDAGRDSDAIDTLTRALDLRPDDAAALEMRGTLYFQENQPEQAYADLTRAVQLEPDRLSARSLRGSVAHQLGETTAGLKDLAEVLRRDERFRPAYIARGNIYMAKGEFARAIDDLTRAIALKPSAYALNKRAACNYFTKNYAKAVADHEAALKLDPDHHATNNYLAWILATCPVASLRDGDRAVQLAKKACEKTDFEAASYLDTLAAACAEAGRFDDAVKVAKRVVELTEPSERGEYQERLDLYRAGRAFHTK